MQNTYTDHENNIQRVSESTGAKFSCVTFHNLHIYPASDKKKYHFSTTSIYNNNSSLMLP